MEVPSNSKLRNKNIVLFLMIILCLLCGCGNDLQQEISLESYQIIPQQERFVDRNDRHRSVQVTYPQIEVYGQEDVTKRLNAMLAAVCLAYGPSALYEQSYDQKEFTYEITYADDDILSICVAGNTSFSSGHAEGTSIGVTYAVHQGKVIYLEDTGISEKDIQTQIDSGIYEIPVVEKKMIKGIDFDQKTRSYAFPIVSMGITPDDVIYAFLYYKYGRLHTLSYAVPYKIDEEFINSLLDYANRSEMEVEYIENNLLDGLHDIRENKELFEACADIINTMQQYEEENYTIGYAPCDINHDGTEEYLLFVHSDLYTCDRGDSLYLVSQYDNTDYIWYKCQPAPIINLENEGQSEAYLIQNEKENIYGIEINKVIYKMDEDNWYDIGL